MPQGTVAAHACVEQRTIDDDCSGEVSRKEIRRSHVACVVSRD